MIRCSSLKIGDGDMTTVTDISALYQEFSQALTEVLAESSVGPARRGRLARTRAAVKKHPNYSEIFSSGRDCIPKMGSYPKRRPLGANKLRARTVVPCHLGRRPHSVCANSLLYSNFGHSGGGIFGRLDQSVRALDNSGSTASTNSNLVYFCSCCSE